MTDFLSVKDVAARLNIRRQGVLSLLKDGELRGVDCSTNGSKRPLWRISEEDLELFILRRTHQTATPRRRKRKTQAKKFF